MLTTRRGTSRTLGTLATAERIDMPRFGRWQVETQLLQFLRGGHLARLQGMRWREGPFARPLLGLRKAALCGFLESEGQGWKEDASNAQPVYQRNRVRLRLVPLLRELLGGEEALHARFQALRHQSMQLSELLEGLCEVQEGVPEASRRLDVSSFPCMAVMVRQEVLWRFLADACDAQVSFEALRSIEKAVRRSPLGPFTWQLGNGWELRHRAHELLVVRRHSCCRSWRSSDLLVTTNSSVEVAMQVERSRNGSDGMILHGVPLGSSVLLRGAQPGDYFRPRVNARAIKLTSFLHRAMQVPPSARPEWPVVLIEAKGARPKVAGVLPDFVSGDFQLEEPKLLPTRLSFSWQRPWPGLEKREKALWKRRAQRFQAAELNSQGGK